MTMIYAILLCLLAPNVRHAFAHQDAQWQDGESYAPTGSDDGYHSAGEYAGGNDVEGYNEGGYSSEGWDMERPVRTVVKHVVRNIPVPHHIPAPVQVPVPKYFKIFKPFAVARPVAVPHVIPVIKHIQKPQPFFTAFPVQRTVPVPKFIGLPVQVRVPKPVFIHVPKIVPVAKKYAVPVTVNIPRPYIVPIFKSVPVPVPHKVPKIINIIKEVPHYVKKPVPVYVDAHGSPDYSSNSYSSSSYSNHYPNEYNGGYEQSEDDPYNSYQPVQPYQKEQDYDGNIAGSQSYSDSQGTEYEPPHFFNHHKFKHNFLNPKLRANRLPNRAPESPNNAHYLQNHNMNGSTYELSVQVNPGVSTPAYGSNLHQGQNMDGASNQVYYQPDNVNNSHIPHFVAKTPSTKFSQPTYNPSPYAEYTEDQQNNQVPSYALQENATVSQYFINSAASQPAPEGQNMISDASKAIHFYSHPNNVLYTQGSEVYAMPQSPSNTNFNYGVDENVYKVAPNVHASFQNYIQHWPNSYVKQQQVQRVVQTNNPRVIHHYPQQQNSEIIQQFAQQNGPQLTEQYTQHSGTHVVQQVAQESNPPMTQQYVNHLPTVSEAMNHFGESVMHKMYPHHNMQTEYQLMQPNNVANANHDSNYMASASTTSHQYVGRSLEQVPSAVYQNVAPKHFPQQQNYAFESTSEEDNYEPSGASVSYSDSSYGRSQEFSQAPQSHARPVATAHIRSATQKAHKNFGSNMHGYTDRATSRGENPTGTTNLKAPIQKVRKNYMGKAHSYIGQEPSHGDAAITTSHLTPPIQTSRKSFANPRDLAQQMPNREESPIIVKNMKPPVQEFHLNAGYPEGYLGQLNDNREESPITTTNMKPPVQEIHKNVGYPPEYKEQLKKQGNKPIIKSSKKVPVQTRHKIFGSSTDSKDGVSKSYSPTSTSYSESSYSNSFSSSSDSPLNLQTVDILEGLTTSLDSESQPQPAYTHHASETDADTKEIIPTFSVIDTGMSIGQFQHFAYPKVDQLEASSETIQPDAITKALQADPIVSAILSEGDDKLGMMEEDDFKTGDDDKDMEDSASSIINVYTNSPFSKGDQSGHSFSFINPEEIASSLSASNQPQTDEESEKKDELSSADIKIIEAITENSDEPLHTSLDAYIPEPVVGEQNTVYKAAAIEPVYKEATDLNP